MIIQMMIMYITEFGNVKVGTAFAGLGTISGRRTGNILQKLHLCQTLV